MYQLPQSVLDYVRNHFAACNGKVAQSLSLFPGTHEESLDNNLISYFGDISGPVKVDPNWTVRFEAHFIGGGRHYYTWEVADIGLMIIFRRNGKIVRSKMAFLQSKKLYASNVKDELIDPYQRMGMGRLMETEGEHMEAIRTKKLLFDEASKYRAFKKNDDQQKAMTSFASKFQMNLYYLFYNPVKIPHSITSPLEGKVDLPENQVGCRVMTKKALDEALKAYAANHQPSYGEIKYLLSGDHLNDEHAGGWRLEYFIVDLVLSCKEGFIDDSPNFESILDILNRRASPIASAISITVDLQE